MEVLVPPYVFFKFKTRYKHERLDFNASSLDAALERACFVDPEERKLLVLYLHDDEDEFSKTFCPLLADETVKRILNQSCLLYIIDMSDCRHHDFVKSQLLLYPELTVLEKRIDRKKTGLVIILPVDDTFEIAGVLQGSVKQKDIIERLQMFIGNLEEELKCERSLAVIKDQNIEKINSAKFQQLMCDMLGDRDYDAFEKEEHEYLKEKIAFAFFGPQQDVCGYNKKQKEKAQVVYEKICEIYDECAKYKDQIIISFVYNCTEPTPAEKESRIKRALKKKQTYDPETDIVPLPIFVLRKCEPPKSELPACRIFMDHDLRVYDTWKDYIASNKLPPCKMVLPKDGRYHTDSEGNVLLEQHMAPSCSVAADVLKGFDITSTVLGLGSGAVFVAAAIPTIAVAPVALVGAGVVGAAVGVYSLVRSSIALADRNQHREDMSFLNSEARGSYINIVAGSLGFVGAGATTAVSQLVARGVNVGAAAQSAVTALNVANIGASGAGILHSSYDVYVQWRYDKVTPSALTVLQLTSSVLFFGHAVYSFKTGSAIVEETQTKVLQEYQDRLRSNRHRKMFQKLKLETIKQNQGNVVSGQAQVIAAIKKISDQNEVFAVLTRSNKMFNKNNIKFAAEGGKITLNGVAVDLSSFGELSKSQQSKFLVNLPPTPEVTLADSYKISEIVTSIFSHDTVMIAGNLLAVNPTNLTAVLSVFETAVQRILVKCLCELLKKVSVNLQNIFREIFPGNDLFVTVLEVVVDFFKEKALNYMTSNQFGMDTTNSELVLKCFQTVVKLVYTNGEVDESTIKDLVVYFMKWLTEKLYRYEEAKQKKAQRGDVRPAKLCYICGGTSYS